MAYTTPRTWIAGEVLTAANMNLHVSDQFTYFKSAPQFDGRISFGASGGVVAGGSTETLLPSGLIDVSDTQAATGANTTETALYTYTLPANALNANGRTLRVTAAGTFGANANTKTVRARIGGISGTIAASMSNGADTNGASWRAEALITRIGSGSQRLSGLIHFASSLHGAVITTTAAVTDSNPMDVVVSGQNGSAVANDIVLEAAWVEFL